MSCGLIGWGCRIHRLYLCRVVRLPQRVSCGLFDWDCRIHQLYLCRWIRLHQRLSWIYDIKECNGGASVMLELWGMWSISLLPSLPGSLRLGVVVLDRVLSMGQIELFSIQTLYKKMTYVKLNCLKKKLFENQT